MTLTIISRNDAAAAGLKRYFLGTACNSAHVCERYVNSTRCVECVADNRKKYRAENAQHVLEKRRLYEAGRREINNDRGRERRVNEPEKVREALNRWRAKNKDRQAAYERGRKAQKNESARRRRPERRATDPLYALQETVRARVGQAFRRVGYRKNSKTAEIIGCSWPDLKRHIEKQFLKGMTWQNRGAAWHVDHITPLAEARSPEEVEGLCHFTNLRPLWATDNHIKHAKRLHLI